MSGERTRRSFLRATCATGAIAAAGLTGCIHTRQGDGDGQDGGEELSGEIAIAGSSTVFPLTTAIAEEFQSPGGAGHTGVNINISRTGTGGGFSNHFCLGNTDFNNASRRIKEAEQELCSENGVEYVRLVAAKDALTVVVSNDNDFLGDPPTLTVEELAQIWEADAAETWSDVNPEWPDEEIQRYGSASTSGTYDYFIEHVQGEERGHTDDYQATERDDTIATGVEGSEYAIGYFGFSYYYQNPDQLQAVAIDAGDGPVEPSLETAASGEYQPLTRNLYIYPAISSLAEEHVAEFARYYVRKTTSQELVSDRVGYVPATEEQQQEQMEKLEDAIQRA